MRVTSKYLYRGLCLPLYLHRVQNTSVGLNRVEMDNVASLRAQIKAWERDFKSKFARDPTVQDIRDQPAIGVSHRVHCRVTLHSISLQPTSTSYTRNCPRQQQLHPGLRPLSRLSLRQKLPRTPVFPV